MFLLKEKAIFFHFILQNTFLVMEILVFGLICVAGAKLNFHF